MNAPAGLTAGQLLGRYELLLPIAQGGMGTVWAARDLGDPGRRERREGRERRAEARLVAVKTMLPALSSDPRFERMFLAESRIASRIRHPNVCAVLAQGEHAGVLYYVMEWVDGDALVGLLGGSSTRQRATPLPCPVAVRLGIETARGLHAAHELRDDQGQLYGVVHRDVSPHNILLTREGTVKIVDFGVAKAVAQGESPTTSTGQMKGKLHFMAPEQVYGDALDRRTDIFALGIVLYQLTTGAHPFTGGHDLAVMARIVRGEPVPPPSSLIPGYPADLEAVVVRALAKRPDDRFATMAELADALEAVEARLGSPRPQIAAFLQSAIAERAGRRAALIQQALRAADARIGRGHPTSSERGGPAHVEGGLTRTDPRRRGTTLATGAALVAAGALLGVTSLLWLRGATAPPGETQGADGSAAPPPATADPEPPSAASYLDLDPPVVPASSGPSPTSAPGADAGPPDAGSPLPGARDDAGLPLGRDRPQPGRAKFRDPGF